MVDQNPRFFQARLKHEWANHHISDFIALWSAFLDTDFCEFVIKNDADGVSQHIEIISTKPLPAEIVLTLGDAIHNLRCALDYTISEILGGRNSRIGFPMDETRESLEDAFRTKPAPRGNKTIPKGKYSLIEETAPGIANVILNTIRPYKRGNDFLWPMNKLDNRDKHRFIVPVIAPQEISGIVLTDKNNNTFCIGGEVDPGGRLKVLRTGMGGLQIQSYGKTSAEILFNEAGIIEGQSVIPTLLQMSHAVLETINGIDEFLTSTGWVRPVS